MMKNFLYLLLSVCLLLPGSVSATVNVETTRHTYSGSGTTGPFACTFRIFKANDIECIKRHPDGSETVLAPDVDYTVSGAGHTSGGSVTLTSALPAGYSLTIMRSMPYLQKKLFTAKQLFTATINSALDALSMEMPQPAEASNLSKSLRNNAGTPVQSAAGFDTIGNYGDDLATAVSVIGSGVQSLWIDKAITLTGDVSVPANITLHFLRSGRINGAYTLTLAAQPEAGPWQIFGDETSLVFTGACTFQMNWTGTTSTAINKAFNAFDGLPGVVFVFAPGTTYTINSTITFGNPGKYVSVHAHGAAFRGTYDDMWFVIHTPSSHGDPGHFMTGFNWRGGEFINSSPTKTASVCMLVTNNRRATLSDMWIQGFRKGLASVKSENQRIAKNMFCKCVWGVHVSGNGVAADITQNMTIEGNLFTNAYDTETPSDAQAAIAFLERTNGLKIIGNTFATDPSNGSHAVIYVVDRAPSYKGTVPGHGHLISANHFEQMAGTVIWYDSTTVYDTTLGFKSIRINDNHFSSVTGCTFTNIKLEKVIDGYLMRNYMHENPTTTITGVNLDADCVRINVTEPGKAGWTISTNFVLACARAQLNIHPSCWPVGAALTGYDNTAHGTGTAMIDVWGLLGNVHKYDEIPPKGYWVTLVAYDTASETSGGTVTLKTDAAAADESGCFIDLAGIPNGRKVHVTSYIPAAADGSLYIEKNASSGANLFLTVYIKQLAR